MITYKLQKKDNQCFTEPILSEEEWLRVLRIADNGQHGRQIDVLKMFLYQTGHKGTCAQIGKEYSMSDSAINLLIQHFGRFAKNNCGKAFRVESYENTDETYWPITMLGQSLKNGRFEWELRPELVSAMQRFLVDKLLNTYREPIISEGLNNQRSYELYKWQLISSAKGKSIEDIIRILVSKDCNFVEKPHAGATIISLLETSPEMVVQVFEKLLVDKSLDERLRDFSVAAKAIIPSGKSSFGDERTAAAFLACVDPQQYTPYTSTIYETYCKYLGINAKSAGQKYSHFLELLQEFIPIEQQDVELQEVLHRETDNLLWSDILNAQDVLWQMQNWIQDSIPQNWLQSFYNERLVAVDSIYDNWYPIYENNVRGFKSFIESDYASSNPDLDILYLLLKKSNNGVSDVSSGQFNAREYEEVLKLWPTIFKILHDSYVKGVVTQDDISTLENTLKPILDRNHPQVLRRIWCSLFPEKLSSVTDVSILMRVFHSINTIEPNAIEFNNNWLDSNLLMMNFFDKRIHFQKPWHRAIFAMDIYWNLNTNDNNTDMNKYINLLKSNRNLILTGAPGTGKTFLAKEIAKAMGCAEDEIDFVQFHPSYDYTDFVEGLRPIEDDNGDVNFERKDGVFKEFCAKALENLLNSQKSLQTLQQETSVRDLLEDFIQDAVETDAQFETQGTKNVFHIIDNKAKSIIIEIPKNEKARVISLPKSDLITLLENKVAISGSKEIQVYFNRKYRAQQDSYTYVLYDKLRNKKTDIKTEKVALIPKKNFVFIIDEINRGELSKIFGELFFAIDPGYRGEKGRVKTQYQNLVEPGDPFDKGFYVPENVYIIGTMNDIDRGVESMDFAIRRRFAWVEVKVEDRVSMLDEIIPEWSEAAERCMTSLNAALKGKAIGLTSAYDIGPAYFLKLEQYDGDFEQLWNYHIKGVVTEYLRGTRGIEEKVTTLKEAFDAYKA